MVTRVLEFGKRYKLEVSGAALGAFFWALAAVSDLLVVDFANGSPYLGLFWGLGVVAAAVAGALYGFFVTAVARFIWYRTPFITVFVLLPGALVYVAGALLIIKFRPGGF
jgi:hypothetical protein